MSLNDLVNATAENASEPVDLTAAAYLLSTIINNLGDQIVELAISEVSALTYNAIINFTYVQLLSHNHTQFNIICTTAKSWFCRWQVVCLILLKIISGVD